MISVRRKELQLPTDSLTVRIASKRCKCSRSMIVQQTADLCTTIINTVVLWVIRLIGNDEAFFNWRL